VANQVSFRASVHEYLEKWTSSAATTLGTSTADLSPIQNAIITYGFMRRIKIRMRNTTGGTGGAFNADYPAKLLNNLSVVDPNGAEVYGGPTWDGYMAYLAQKYGSYKAVNDPSLATPAFYDASVTAPLFCWEIPFEFAESSGLGSLPNFDAQSPYQLKAILDTVGNAYQTAPTTNPAVVLDYILEAWTVPDTVNRQSGVGQTLFPPGIGPGVFGTRGVGCTVQHWTLSNPSITAATAMSARLIRKGNINRGYVLVVRNSSGARIALANFPNPITFSLDGAPLWANIDPAIIVENWFRREVGQAGNTNHALDTGVLPVLFDAVDAINIQGVDGTLGMQGFLGSNEASRIEFAGTWGATASQLQVLTNDVNGVSLEGSPYAFSYAQQLASPTMPSVRTG
jgi:hypothetical protein